MKKLLMLAVLLVVLMPLFSIDFIPASGEEVPLESRNEQIYFHNFIHEYNWEGADTWAVRFDIEDFYETSADVSFQPDGVDFFYSSLDQFPISLSLRTSYFSQPNDTILVSTTISADELAYGWNHWSFDLDSLAMEYWVVMEFETNDINRFIPGSYGSGNYSYYKNGDYFVNLNRPSEFLVNLTGDLLPNEPVGDVWVEDFYLPEGTENNTVMNPIIKLSAEAAPGDSIGFHDVSLTYNRVSPFRSYDIDTLWVGTIGTDEIIELDTADYGMLGLEKEDDNAEYKFLINVNSDKDGFSFNNSAEIIVDELQRGVGTMLVENSVKLEHGLSEDMWALEETGLQNYDAEVINYFTDIGDSLYVHDAAQRALFYHFSVFPACVVNGDRKINGILNEQIFQDSLQSYLDGASERSVKLLTDFQVDALAQPNDSVNVNITFRNDEYNYFSSRITNTKLFVAAVEDEISTLPEMYGSTMLQIIHEIDGSELGELTPAALGFEIEKSFSFFQNEIDTFEGDLNNCRLFFWLQNTDTGEIHHFESLAFSEFGTTSGPNEEVPQSGFNVSIYPNPFNGRDELQVKLQGLARSVKQSEMKIYNVKGQLVRKIENKQDRADQLSWDGKDSSSNEVSSGVYLLKIAVDDGKSIQTRNRKCLIINK